MYMAVTLKIQLLNFGEYTIMQPVCLCHQTYLEFPVVQVWYVTVCVRVRFKVHVHTHVCSSPLWILY